MDQLFLLHRHGQSPESLQSAPGAERALHWKTCLRQMAFFSASTVPTEIYEGDQLYQGAEAYALILEVICGLQSPVVGETEVFGQFKKFVGEIADLDSEAAFAWKPVFAALIQTAKSLRAEHLVGLGSQGYGSLVRKLAKADAKVSFFGSGQLVEEIIPWLAKEKSLQVLCRNPAKAQGLRKKCETLKIAALHEVAGTSYPCLVVAAPVTDQELLQWLERQGSQVQKILDLRAELQSPELFSRYQFVGLRDFFASIEKNKADLQDKVLQLRALVRSKAQEYCDRTLLRPYGWEDLCV